MAFDSNVLAAIAKGVNLNPLGSLAEGWQAGVKQRQAQQEIDDLRKYREESIKVDREKLAQGPDIPTSIQEYLYGLQNPGYAKQQENNKLIILPDGRVFRQADLLNRPVGNDPSGVPQPVESGAKPFRPRASDLTGYDDTKTELAEIDASIKALQRGFDIAPKTYRGFAAGQRASAVQGLTPWLPAGTFDPDTEEGALLTKEWNTVAYPEALKAAAKYLKPLSEKEGTEMRTTLADPDADPKLKQAIFTRLMEAARARRNAKADILKRYEAEVNPPAQSPVGGVAPPPAGGPAPVQGDAATESVGVDSGNGPEMPAAPQSEADYNALPSGTYYIHPKTGNVKRKP